MFWLAWWPTLIAFVVAALFAATGMTGGIAARRRIGFLGFLKELFAGAGDLLSGWEQGGMRPDLETAAANSLTHKMPYAPAIAAGSPISLFPH